MHIYIYPHTYSSIMQQRELKKLKSEETREKVETQGK